MSLEQAKELVQVYQMGQSVWDLSDAAAEIGIEGRPAKAEFYSVLKEVKWPFIAHYEGEQSHFVVVYEVYDEYLVVCDPAKGLEILSKSEFEKKWSGYLVEFEPTEQFEKKVITIPSRKLFFNLLVENKSLIIPIFILSIIISFLGLAASYFVKIIIDEILPLNAIGNIAFFGLSLILLYLFYLGLGVVRSYLQAVTTKKILKGNIMSYLEHIAYLPIRFHETRSIGNLYNRVNDIEKIQIAVGQSLISLFCDVVLMVIALAVMLYYNVGLSLLVVIFIPILLIITFVVSIPLNKLQRMVMIKQGEVAGRFIDTFVGIKEIKTFSAEKYFTKRIKDKSEEYIKTNFKLNIITYISEGFNFFILSLLTVVILWYGTTLVAAGQITLGSLMLFFSLVAYVTSPVQHFTSVLFLILDAMAAIERVQGINEIPLETDVFPGRDNLKNVKGKIVFDDVTFGYRKNISILKNISFSVEPGQMCAIVGETGVGKTTLVNLLCGFYMPSSGKIFIDDKCMQDISIVSLRENISMVSQKSHLFGDSLYRNITMGEDFALEEIEQSASSIKAFNFIDDLPQKFYSPVFSGGSNFSAGQIQRISLLRALIRDKPILIFDEATSNLDSITEKLILDVLKRERKDKTTFLIGHRLSTIALADKILVIDKGSIVEVGTFRELVSNKGVFYSLFRAQLEAGKDINQTE
jgi:ATP-binding cassette subfamily B protein